MKRFLGIILAVAICATMFAAFSFTTTVGAADANLFTGDIGTFEGTLSADWKAFGGGALAIDKTNAHGGKNSVKMTGRTGSWFAPSFNIYNIVKKAGPGMYTLKAWVYSEEAASTGVTIIIRGDKTGFPSFMSDVSGNVYSKATASFPVAAGEWVEVSSDFTVQAADITAATGNFTFCVDGFPADATEIYVDDVSLAVGVAPTAMPGVPAYKFTMAGNYKSIPDTYVNLVPIKGEIITGTTAKLNIKNTGTNPITVYIDVRNDDTTWTHAVDGEKTTIAPGKFATLTIPSIPATGKFPILEIVFASANDSFVIGNFKASGVDFGSMQGMSFTQVDGTGMFDGASSTMDPATLPTPKPSPTPSPAPTPTIAVTVKPTATVIATVTPAPKASNAGAVIGIIIAIVVIGGGAAAYFLLAKKKKTPGDVE